MLSGHLTLPTSPEGIALTKKPRVLRQFLDLFLCSTSFFVPEFPVFSMPSFPCPQLSEHCVLSPAALGTDPGGWCGIYISPKVVHHGAVSLMCFRPVSDFSPHSSFPVPPPASLLPPPSSLPEALLLSAYPHTYVCLKSYPKLTSPLVSKLTSQAQLATLKGWFIQWVA